MKQKNIEELSNDAKRFMLKMDEEEKEKYLIFLAACDDASACRDNLDLASCNSCSMRKKCEIQNRQKLWLNR